MVTLLLFLLLAAPGYSYLPGEATILSDLLDEITEHERRGELFYRIVDQDGLTLLITGRRIRVGDLYLTSDNRLFEVYSVEDRLARARFKEKVKLEGAAARSPVFTPSAIPAQAQPAYRIAIYHTHNAESFVPSDGTDSIYGVGGIHAVGAAFRDALEGKNITVDYSERLHLPHDRGAYRRSRVTAIELLGRRPDAIFDVHRDAAPWEAYALELDGETLTQIMFVVGRSNPGFALNQKFAYDLKGYADRIHPGLIRGVLVAWGSYNQELFPLSLLLEVGAHTNTREAAVRGITRFAEVVAYYFYGPRFLENGAEQELDRDEPLPPALYRDAGGISQAVSATVVGLLLASLVAALGFYFLNNPGSLEELSAWRENFPEKFKLLMKTSKQYIAGFPGWLSRRRRELPGDLRYAWRRLLQEGRRLPGLFEAGAAGLALHLRIFIERLPSYIQQGRLNFARALRRLLQEGRRLPGFLAAAVFRLPLVFRALLNRLASFSRKSIICLERLWSDLQTRTKLLLQLIRRRRRI